MITYDGVEVIVELGRLKLGKESGGIVGTDKFGSPET